MRTSSSSAALALACVAACNGVLGLDDTTVDSDGDGIADASDSCPTDPNADQFDSDGDGIGDACASCGAPIDKDLDGDGYDDGCDRCIGDGPSGVDADGDGVDDGCDPCIGLVGNTGVDADADGIDDGCLLCFTAVGADADSDGLDDACDLCATGPPHDEDADADEDGCDNCPADVDPSQSLDMADGDTVGLACDPDEGSRHVRVLFDPFLTSNTTEWTRTDAGWTFANDVARVVTSDAQRISSARLAQGLAYSVKTKLQRGPIGAGASAAIFLTQLGGGAILTCEVSATGTLALDFAPPLGPVQHMEATELVDVTGPIILVASRSPLGILTPRWLCTAITPAATITMNGINASDTITWFVGLRVRGDATLEWIDAISGQ